MRRSAVRMALKGLLIGSGLVVGCVVAAVALTDPDPATLPRRGAGWLASRTLGSPVAAASTANSSGAKGPARTEAVPPFSDIAFDDSGYSASIRFSKPIADPSSLGEMRASVEGREARGIAYLEAKLAALSASDLATSANIRLLMGSLRMFHGDWAAASEEFAHAQAADPSRPEAFRANQEALRGVAALRRGEVENCVACCNESSCIFPLDAKAVHLRTSGSREAIRRFTDYLHQRPEDLGVRWLLNVACMTLGEYPAGVPSEFLLPLGRLEAKPGDPRRMVNVASKVGLNARGEAMAGACLVDDFDDDGRLDVFLPTTDVDRGATFLRNKGDGTFEDASDAAGLKDQVLSLNACHADFDNDGHLDILMMRGAWEVPRRMSLLRNLGGRFEDVTLAAGLGMPISTQAAGWADFDNDGLVDLYVAGELDAKRPDARNRGRLYRNLGEGKFQDVALSAGVTNDRFGKGVAWGDFDDDGDPDLYVANLGQPNRLYRNRGDGTFEDVAPDLRVTEPIDAFACWFWDFDDDGRLDLWVNPNHATLTEVVRDQLGRPTTGERPRLYRNLGAEGFRDVTTEVGADRIVLPMGSNFGDIDNDGCLDVYLGTGRPSYAYLMPNVLLRNDQGRRFEDVTAATGTGHLQKGHGVAFADWDRDGDADLFVQAGGAAPGDRAHAVLFQNPGSPGHHWLTVKLMGTRTNRAALGARIRVEVVGPGGSTVERHRVISAGSSFGGNPLACTIGLGPAGSIRTLEIRWPTGGIRQVFQNISADRAIEVVEGAEGYRVLDAPPLGPR